MARTLNVQTPGAQPSAQEPTPAPLSPSGDDNEALINDAPDLDITKAAAPAAPPELPPDLEAIIERRVAVALGKQQKAAAVVKMGAATVKARPYAEVVAEYQAMTPKQRIDAKSVLTDMGWFVPPEYGSRPAHLARDEFGNVVS